ncbi:MAG TPA: hypothetical protein VGI56_08550 [Galbitalea sp.]|jgi:hypothetical protein
MNPDDFHDPGTEAADRRDNRRAVVVAVVAAIVVGIASAVLMASEVGSSGNAVPSPSHSSVHSEAKLGGAE